MNQHRTTAPVLHLSNGVLELHFPRPWRCNEINPTSSYDAAKAWAAWLRENAYKYPPGTSFHIVTTREKSPN